MDLLNDSGRAGIVVPEGILFDSSKKAVRQELLSQFNLDVILALPEHTFQPYSGVDANVLFFERDNSGTDEFWFYDARSNFENIKDENPLNYEKHFKDFVDNKNSRGSCERYFKVNTEEIDDENRELHLKKYKQFKHEGHRSPDVIAQDIRDELDTINQELEQIVGDTTTISNQGMPTQIPPKQETLPDGWDLVKLKDVSRVETGGTPKTDIEEYWGGDITWLRVSDVDEKMYVTDSEDKITKRGMKEGSCSLIPKGGVVLSTRATIGKVAIAGEDLATNQGFKSVIPNQEILDSKYLAYYLDSITEYLESLGKGATYDEINKTQVQNLEIPLPPIETQKQIVNEIENQNEEKVRKSVESVQQLFSEYMDSLSIHAFQGGFIE